MAKQEDKLVFLHLPDYWVGGVLVEDHWLGEFFATDEELMDWAVKEDLDELYLDLIDKMCEGCEVYRSWWERVNGTEE